MNDTPHRILVVDDEPSITEFVSYALKKEGFFTDVVDNGEDALALATKNSYDLFVLDIMLPGMDGYELCRRLRSKTTVPVLFLSARDTELDKVVGLEIGGDDYLAKPFGVRELIARVRALLRRGSGGDFPGANHAVTASGITLDEDAHTASGANGEIDLTPREFELLASLMKNAGKVVSREDLLRDAWGWEYLTETKTVDTHIKSPPGTIPAWWKRFAATDTGSSNKKTANILLAAGNAAFASRRRGSGSDLLPRLRHSVEGVFAACSRRSCGVHVQPYYRTFHI